MNSTRIKITPTDLNQQITISFFGIQMSYHKSIETFSIHSYGIFSTLRNFKTNITISPNQLLHMCAQNDIPLKFTIKEENFLVSAFVNNGYIIESGENISSGNIIYLSIVPNFTTEGVSSKSLEINCETNSSAPVLEGFSNPFGDDIFYILPEEGAYTLDQIKAYSRDHQNIFTNWPGETFLPDNLPCDEIIKMDIISKIVTIGAGKSVCTQGSFVYASKDKFKATVHNLSNPQEKPVEVENPFSVAGNYLSVINCSDSTKECKVHVISINQPQSTNEGTLSSVFTTKNSLNMKEKLQFTKQSSKSLILQSHSTQNKEIEVTTDHEKVIGVLRNSAGESGEKKLKGKTIWATLNPDMEGEPGEVNVEININKVKESTEEAEESLFPDDILFDIPIGVKTEEELKENTRNSSLKSVANNGGLGTGAIVGIVIGVIAFIAIICILVWFFVFRKKSKNNESGSGEKV
ncbi:hypothetical protein TVAG_228940 [Trichomonas vaginalis G3]|uniref:Uncharacterized protein n=1 Tax=Trichomonas vaginalis (strain ATCC PRA-98 / G3) TaxID=412133 RepID=A2DJ56_TRIV3|nr:glycoprotein 38 family [Trichomonas vaginalis G3]EAY19631.1 hypothetical protein TVAG_228940 [Trichomonas vaginalis G3]KAI5515071.1 glycoprotein 38 family [Trichomonas vaginalis G3]|eukprot:XP_001580617.1 hypothetical protein [Trichomonas vaginalis G3]